MKILDTNYTCQVIALPPKIRVEGLDNLVEVNVFGNSCLISKDSPEGLYLFFPAETVIHPTFLSKNNLFRHSHLNEDPTQKGFFEDPGRVRTVKFKGVISTGFVTPVQSLYSLTGDLGLKAGDEFNEIGGYTICRKYVVTSRNQDGPNQKKSTILDSIVDRLFAPEHFDTEHLLKNSHKIGYNDFITCSIKLHGTSGRVFHTLIHKKLSFWERIAKRLGISVREEVYDYVVGSRRVIKSVGFDSLPGKNHYYESGDLWTEVAKQYFNDKLYKGEAVYFEIIGKTFSGEAIQEGYSYRLNMPTPYIYRITNINAQGVEIDLTPEQMEGRAKQLGVPCCPIIFQGRLSEFIQLYDKSVDSFDDRDKGRHLEHVFYDILLEKASIFDPSVVEEGFCVRIEGYPKCQIFKIKSKKFLANETAMNDAGKSNLEDEQQL